MLWANIIIIYRTEWNTIGDELKLKRKYSIGKFCTAKKQVVSLPWNVDKISYLLDGKYYRTIEQMPKVPCKLSKICRIYHLPFLCLYGFAAFTMEFHSKLYEHILCTNTFSVGCWSSAKCPCLWFISLYWHCFYCLFIQQLDSILFWLLTFCFSFILLGVWDSLCLFMHF